MNTSYPSVPGVYIFRDSSGKPLYIGKAKSLQSRIRQYFHNAKTNERLDCLIKNHDSITTIMTKNETEALLLEAQLIKEHQPKFNILLKGGQPFIYLLFTASTLPELKLVRNKQQKGTYYGPFVHKQQARDVHRFLSKTFALYRCSYKIKDGCLRYHLGTCAGTCRPDFDDAQYIIRVELAKQIVRKDHAQFLNIVTDTIAQYSKKLDFEQAQQLTHYLQQCDALFETIRLRYSDDTYAKKSALIITKADTNKHYQAARAELESLLQLKQKIISIDCFDISHFQSRSIVGSCIRFVHGLPVPNKFRRFMIKTLDKQNDYAALQEIVARRYRNKADIPDLIVIDGGRGQRSAVIHLVHGIPIIALAKKEERLYGLPGTNGYTLDIHSPLGKLLISLRDYTHHFAINYHRTRQSITAQQEMGRRKKEPKKQ